MNEKNVYNEMSIENFRKADNDINHLFINRWSPRSFSDKELKEETLFKLFEAARFAPSAFNEQPWHFIYALSSDLAWQKIYDTLVDFNKLWTKKAKAFIVILSKKRFSQNDKLNETSHFDTGAAWQNLALQARDLGLVAHAMSGLNFTQLKENLNVSDDYDIIATVALGYPGLVNDLPDDLKEIEKPSNRKKINEFISREKFI